ncbi:MAG TPA: hypothetical protein VF277_09250 [Steroidobacteraceae bacterium]
MTTKDLFTIRGYSKRPGFCRDGAKKWFAAHDLDWRDFVKNGIDADVLTATGDGLALALVAWAKTRQAGMTEQGDG